MIDQPTLNLILAILNLALVIYHGYKIVTLSAELEILEATLKQANQIIKSKESTIDRLTGINDSLLNSALTS